MNEKIKNFKDLKIWQEGIVLVKEIYDALKLFPEDERFSLISQMRRASVSVPSNIAEGFRRKHRKEFKQFLSISLGSLAELETQIIIAHELGYMNKTKLLNFSEKIDHLCRMISSLINRIEH
jgi:four helix bundle protein